MKLLGTAVAVAAFGLCAGAGQASVITTGFTFAVASGCGSTATGNHFHSSTGGDFGNPAGKAEVGSYGGATCEEVRGLSEYDLSGLTTSSAAFVSFEVFSLAGLFPGSNGYLYTGDIAIEAYLGNNLENTSDYQAASTGSVGAFSTIGLVAGNTLSFDITSIFNSAVTAGDVSLGIRLMIDDAPNGGAITFDSFRLTTDDQTTGGGGGGTGTVPLPAGMPLILTGLAALGLVRRRTAHG